MSRRGRFGKYGDLKRKSRLRAARIGKRKRLGTKAYSRGRSKKSAKRRKILGILGEKG